MTTPHQVQTEATSLAVAEEDTLGNTTPVASGWHYVEPNSYGSLGAKFKKMPRDPITKSQQLLKSMLVDEDSGIEFEVDVTKENIDRFAKGIYRSAAKHSGGTGQSSWYPTLVTASVKAFLDLGAHTTNVDTVVEAKLGGADGNSITIQTVADGTGTGTLNEAAYPAIVFHYAAGVTTVADLETAIRASTYLHIKTAGTSAHVFAAPADTLAATNLATGAAGSFTVDALGTLPARRLVFARTFANPQNRGLFLVVAGSDGTHVAVDHVVAETPAATGAAQLDVAGVRGASGDFSIDGDGNLTSVSHDFTTDGLNEYQWVYLGNTLTGNAFANTAYTGSARIAKGGIAAHKLTFERRDWTPGAIDAGAGKQVDLYFTRWFRNVAMDDGDYIKYPSYVFEVLFPFDSGNVYWYPLGNMIDECTWNIPLTSKATMSLKFIGTKSLSPTTSRTTGPSAARSTSAKVGISTAQDIARLAVTNVDESGLGTSFTSVKIVDKNNVSPQKEIGQLGARMMNVGKHEVTSSNDYIFTDATVITAVRDNRDVALGMLMRNQDFGAMIDISAMTIDTSDVKLEKNKSVMLGSTSTAHMDDVGAFTDSLSVFAFLPNPTT